jgi:ribosomal protein S6
MERVYESMLILRPDLDEKEKEEVFSRIIKKIESLGGKINDSKIWQKKEDFNIRLEVEVRKRKNSIKAVIGCFVFVLMRKN